MKRMRKTIRHPETLRKNKQKTNPYAGIDRQFDLHGLTVIEAQRILENIISMNSGRKVLINHGKGSGILRAMVRNYCSKDPRVKNIRKGEESTIPGGDGITILTL